MLHVHITKVMGMYNKIFQVIARNYICNKFTSKETSPQNAQSLSWTSISPQPENMKLGGSELDSSVRREKGD